MKDKTPNSINYCPLIYMIIAIILIFLLAWCLMDYFLCPNERSTFGDMFGGVSALFSGLAFAGMIFTIMLQKEELSLQREELKQTNNVLSQQKEEFKRQNETLGLERFEHTFFSMLEMQQVITDKLILHIRENSNSMKGGGTYNYNKDTENEIRGREVFRMLYMRNKFELPLNGWRDYGGLLENIKKNGTNWFTKNDELSFLDHYFQYLYRLIKFVDKNDLLDKEGSFKKHYEYICILRASLSDYELGVIFYYCLSENGCKEFKPLAERYALFNNIRDKVLSDPKKDKDDFEDGAFEFQNS